MTPDERIAELTARAEAAEARVAELERDAGRYRWLRENASEIGCYGKDSYYNFEDFRYMPTERDDLDAAIDAAIDALAGQPTTDTQRQGET